MLADAESTEMRQLRLDDDEVSAWLTLTAVRLVLATRLGIEDDTADLTTPVRRLQLAGLPTRGCSRRSS
jgi:hypothetical protein